MITNPNIALGNENIANFPVQNNLYNKSALKADTAVISHQPDARQIQMTEAKIRVFSSSAHNKAELEAAYRQHFEELYRYAFSMVRDQSHAEDVVQSVFLEGWQDSARMHIHTSLRAYLFKAVYFKCLNELKHQQVKRKFELFFTSGKELVVKEDTLQKELKQKIEEALQTLPPECRKIFEMCKLEGFKYYEVADKLRISPKTVENQMGKALKSLRQQLSRYLFPITLLIIFWS
ncbi:MAG: RNA polymerase sigma-70 factor [Saprospiraceae bacterium]|jgi:RNA polymerase sigma-70 factor (ECF subfamily)|nr:RNA polymerase sigma-70 factor [Saprospiraceae bacterium]MBP9193647.1 RNA polymerase sigma-70 factor [Saprospiraceae bacterium]